MRGGILHWVDDPRDAVTAVFREERTRLLASLIRRAGDFELAEDALQDAFAAALVAWPQSGIPRNPAAWLLTTARSRLIDRVRRESAFVRVAESRARAEAARREEAGCTEDDPGDAMLADDRLRLVFTCCHPALDPESRVALTLQAVGGLTALEVGRAFLVSEAVMSQRLVRVKRKIRDAGIPYRVPPPEVLPERIDDVLRVVYLLFNEGYLAAQGDALVRTDLCDEAIRLARLLHTLMSDDAETAGLCALMLFHHARRAARVDADGTLVPLDEQDRSRWDRPLVVEGTAILDVALSRARPGPYQVQAAISALHCAAPTAGATDWRQIASLYAALRRFDPSPVVELNEIVAVAMHVGPEEGLARLADFARRASLDGYQPFHAATADLLRRAGRHADAVGAYDRALQLTRNAGERRFLERRRAALR